jgi:CO dehydrogenase maturation factor
MRLLADDIVLLDTPVGLEHFGRSVAEGFTCAVVVADPTYNALSVARESGALARQLGIGHIVLVINRIGRPEDMDKVRDRAGHLDEFSRVVPLPFAPEVVVTEPEVGPLLVTESEFMQAVRSLADAITHRCEVRSSDFP